MAMKMKFGRLRKFFLTIFCAYVVFFVFSMWWKSTSIRPSQRMPLVDFYRWVRNDSFAKTVNSSCERVTVVVASKSPADGEQVANMLHTLFIHRPRPWHFYNIAANQQTSVIVKTLVSSMLNSTDFSMSNVIPNEVSEHFPHPYSILDHLSGLAQSGGKVIFINKNVHLLEDIGILWAMFHNFGPTQMFGAVPDPKSEGSYYTDVMLFDIGKLEKRRVTWRQNTYEEVMFSLKSIDDVMYPIPCGWGVRLTEDFSFDDCPTHLKPQALIYGNLMTSSDEQPSVSELRNHVSSILSLNPSPFAQLKCPSTSAPDVAPSDPPQLCSDFRFTAKLKHKTLLYFIGGANSYEQGLEDVTLVTQLTIDRFESLEKMLKNWRGPASVVFYLTPSDVPFLKSLHHESSIRRRKNVAFHLVYKRGALYPINYLRNVGVNASSTMYTLFIDVDLVPNPGIYQAVRRYIKQLVDPGEKIALVIPSFEALDDLEKFPSNKTELMKLVQEDKVIGYRMNQKWNLGHRPTNYEKYYETNSPYEAIWKDAFEPYTVLEKNIAPSYNEDLLERMGDKIAFARVVYAWGFKFIVLPDQFVLHLKHPISEGTKLWKRWGNGYQRCAEILNKEFRDQLDEKYYDLFEHHD